MRAVMVIPKPTTVLSRAVGVVFLGGVTAAILAVLSVLAIKHMTLKQAIQVLAFLSRLQLMNRSRP